MTIHIDGQTLADIRMQLGIKELKGITIRAISAPDPTDKFRKSTFAGFVVDARSCGLEKTERRFETYIEASNGVEDLLRRLELDVRYGKDG